MNLVPQPIPQPKKKWLTTWQKIIASKFLLISILVHFLFGAGATVYVVQRYQANRKLSFSGGPPPVNPSTRALEHKVSMQKKKNTMSAPAQAKRITTVGMAKVALPEIVSMPNATQVVPNRMGGTGGMGQGFGSGGGGGMGTGGGGFGFKLPNVMNDRCSAASRAAAMRASGGDPRSEEAIVKALQWLKGHQNGDGSFGQEFPVAMTGLALLSFMGHCERPTSKEYGECVRKAIDYLVGAAGGDGRIAHAGGNPWVYEHGIATYALGESYILTKEPKIAEVLKKAVGLIVQGQSPDGGWHYDFNKQVGDTSVTGWQVQALKAAHLSGLEMEGVEKAMKNSVEQVTRVRGKKGGFGYTGPEDRPGLTAVGVLILQIVRHERGQEVRQALTWLTEEAMPKVDYAAGDANLYAWYYATQACYQHGGSMWGRWNRQCQPQLLEHQSADGSWPETGGKKEGGLYWTGTGTTMDAQVYRTTLCTLMLEVYYRYLASSRV